MRFISLPQAKPKYYDYDSDEAGAATTATTVGDQAVVQQQQPAVDQGGYLAQYTLVEGDSYQYSYTTVQEPAQDTYTQLYRYDWGQPSSLLYTYKIKYFFNA